MQTENRDRTVKDKGKSTGLRGYAIVLGILCLFSSGLFSRCANIGGTPEGGPKDTLPPRVVGMTPIFNATNIHPKEIIIDFDEYIQLKDQQNQFFTSPFLSKKPTVAYKNRSVIITVDAPLDSATTYVFNLGSSVVDNNEGNPLHNLKYTFSTGAHIDSMFMSGSVSNALTADTVAGAYIFFYDALLDSIPERDSLLYDTWKAAAVTKTLSDGGFVFANLKPIDYRVYALLDNNNNQMYDPGSDEVAFLDTVYNPSKMPSFLMWYDSLRGHAVAEPQLFLRSFKEDHERRQNLATHTRPISQELVLTFSAPHPQIESFTLQGVDMAQVMAEQPKETRDSVLYWLNVPAEELPDTLFGNIVYQRHDSVGTLYTHSQDLRFVWRKPFEAPKREEREPRVSRRERRRRAAAAAQEAVADEVETLANILGPHVVPPESPEDAVLNPQLMSPYEADSLLHSGVVQPDSLAGEMPDSVPPSKMVYRFTQGEIIPGFPPELDFDLPVTRLDTASLRFLKLPGAEEKTDQSAPESESGDASGMPEPLTLETDSLLIRRYRLLAAWEDGARYSLFIPPGAIQTIDGEVNDSISVTFSVAKNKEMASITLNMENAREDTEYIVQLLSENGSEILREIPHLTGGLHSIHYIKPGKVRLRMIEDRNGNGKWDTGNLLRRIQPEVVRLYYSGGEAAFEVVENVELELDVDLTELFLPRMHTESELYDHEHDHDHEGEMHNHDHGIGESEGEATEPIRTNIRTSEAHLEGYEVIDLKADKKARKEARRVARAERRARRNTPPEAQVSEPGNNPEDE